MQVKVKKLHPDAIMPQYATEGAACFDLHAIGDGLLPIGDGGLPIEFYGSVIFRTGLSFEIPQGYAMMVYSRSGHGFKHDTRLANCVGVIDSDYRGELLVKLTNDGEESFVVRKNDRIAQAMIVPVPRVELVEADSLGDTERGAGGFGSTGT